MKRSLFNAIVKDKTVHSITTRTNEGGKLVEEYPWDRWRGIEAEGNPEDWGDATTSVLVQLTLPEYHLLRTARSIATDMVAAREEQKKKVDTICVRTRRSEEPQCLRPI